MNEEKEDFKVVAPKATPEDSLIDSCCSTNSTDDLPYGRFLEEDRLPPSDASSCWQRSGVGGQGHGQGQGQTVLRIDDIDVRVDVESDDDSLRRKSPRGGRGRGGVEEAISSSSFSPLEVRLLQKATIVDDAETFGGQTRSKECSLLRLRNDVFNSSSITTSSAEDSAVAAGVKTFQSSKDAKVKFLADKQQPSSSFPSSSPFISSLQKLNNKPVNDFSFELEEVKTLKKFVKEEVEAERTSLVSSSSANIIRQQQQRQSSIGDTEDLLLKSSSVTLCPAATDQLHGSETNTLVGSRICLKRCLLTLSIDSSSDCSFNPQQDGGTGIRRPGLPATVKASQAALDGRPRFSPGSPSYDGRHSRFSHIGSHALDVFFSPEEEALMGEEEPLWRPVATTIRGGGSPTDSSMFFPSQPTSYFNEVVFPFEDEEMEENEEGEDTVRRLRRRRKETMPPLAPPIDHVVSSSFEENLLLSGDNNPSQISSNFYRLSIKESSSSSSSSSSSTMTRKEEERRRKDEFNSKRKKELDHRRIPNRRSNEQMSFSGGSPRPSILEGSNTDNDSCLRREEGLPSLIRHGGQPMRMVSGGQGLPGGHPADGSPVEDMSISTAAVNDDKYAEREEKKKTESISSTTSRKIPVLRSILRDRRTTGNSLDGTTKRDSLEEAKKRNSLDVAAKRDSVDGVKRNRKGSPS